jgi:HSP20 family protein
MFDLMPWKKRTPKQVVRFRNELDDLFNRFFDVGFPEPGEFLKEFDWYPSVDVSESGNTITVKAEIPGVDAKDIEVSLEGTVLTIKGEKKQEKEEKEENHHHSERSYGYFHRRVELPAEVDPDKVEAAYKNGVLTIQLIKTKESATRKIEIKS